MVKKILSAFIVGTTLLVASAASATHYVTGQSAVDSNEIRWGGSTTYSLNYSNGVVVWNAENPVDIAPDTIWTAEDLTLSDINMGSYPWYAAYQYYSVGSDRMFFNLAHMGSIGTSSRNHVATHELGHALGLNHSISGNVMYSNEWNTSLGTQDLSDYHYLWGY